MPPDFVPQFAPGQPSFLSVGDSCTLSKSFNEQDVFSFGSASGDWNPVHYPKVSREWEEQQRKGSETSLSASTAPSPSSSGSSSATAAVSAPRFPAPIVHGLLTSSLIGTLFASHFPGCIYLSQSLSFKAPLFYDEVCTARIEVLSIERKNRVKCRTVIDKVREGKTTTVVEGEATVLVESLTQAQNGKESVE
jgi:acyl dehydratase